jgi:glycerol uptake facilitator-like aquaporin
MEWQPFGGPEFNMDEEEAHVEAFMSEFFATLLLLFLIYFVNWEWNFGKYHYWIKQSLTALGIRALIELFPTAGPAMNPMLATSWAVFGVGTTYEFPSEMEHYIVYWLAPALAAILASFCYVLYAGGTVFGSSVPIGPLKKMATKKKKE